MVPFLDLSSLGLPKPTLAMRLRAWWRMTREILFDAQPSAPLIKIGDSEIEFGENEVPPEGHLEFTHVAERVTRVKKLVIQSPALKDLVIEQIYAGPYSQIVSDGSIPAHIFGPNSELSNGIALESVQPGSRIRIQLKNLSKKPVWVSARAITKVLL